MAKQHTTSLARSAQPLYIEPAPRYTSYFDPRLSGDLQFVSSSALKQGTHIVGGPGSSKSRLLARVDENQYPNKQVLAPLRAQLTRRDGVSVRKLLASLQLPEGETQKRTIQSSKSARLNNTTHAPTDNPSAQSDATVSHPAVQVRIGGVDEDPWQA